MDDTGSLSEAINNAVAAWCANNDNSLLTNFVFAAEFLEEDGGYPTHAVVTPPRASTSSSLGLVVYARNLFSEVQRRDMLEMIYTDEELGED